MHAVFINNLYHPYFVGGGELSVQSLAERLVHEIDKVSVITLGQEASSEILNGVHVHRIPLANVHWPFGQDGTLAQKALFHTLDVRNPAMARRVQKMLKALKPDIVHTNNLSGFSVSVWREASRAGIPVVHSIRDYYLLCYRSNMFRNNKPCSRQCADCSLFSYYKKKFDQYVDHVVGISQSILKTHQASGMFVKCASSVIYNSVAEAKVAPEPRQGAMRFGYIGRLSPQKGVDLLVQAFLSEEISGQANLQITGEGKQEFIDQLLEMAKDHPEIQFTGFRHIHDFMNSIDVLVVPSVWPEPFGRVIAEAHTYGIPVIGSDAGGIAEIIDHGHTGLVVSSGSVKDMQEAMRRFSESPSLVSEMKEKCLKSAKRFQPQKVAAQYLDLYRALLKKE